MILALMNVSSAVIGEAIRSSWHSWPHSSGMSAGVSGPLGNQSCFLAALSIRNSPEWHLLMVLSVLTQSPLPLLSQVHGNTDFKPAVFHHRVELLHFSLRVLILPPALSFQHYHRKYSIQHEFPRGLPGCGFNRYYSIFHFFSFPFP